VALWVVARDLISDAVVRSVAPRQLSMPKQGDAAGVLDPPVAHRDWIDWRPRSADGLKARLHELTAGRTLVIDDFHFSSPLLAAKLARGADGSNAGEEGRLDAHTFSRAKPSARCVGRRYVVER
jgi:hypothetical protein